MWSSAWVSNMFPERSQTKVKFYWQDWKSKCHQCKWVRINNRWTTLEVDKWIFVVTDLCMKTKVLAVGPNVGWGHINQKVQLTIWENVLQKMNVNLKAIVVVAKFRKQNTLFFSELGLLNINLYPPSPWGILERHNKTIKTFTYTFQYEKNLPKDLKIYPYFYKQI